MASDSAISRSNVVLDLTKDLMTITSGGTRNHIQRILVVGLGTLSAPIDLLVAESTGGTPPATGFSGEMLDPDHEVFPINFDASWDWAVEPTIGNPLFHLMLNADGGVAEWEGGGDQPGQLALLSAGLDRRVSIRPVLGAGQPVSITIISDSDVYY